MSVWFFCSFVTIRSILVFVASLPIRSILVFVAVRIAALRQTLTPVANRLSLHTFLNVADAYLNSLYNSSFALS